MHEMNGIIYINLDERTERRGMIEAEIERMEFPKAKTYRLSATLDRLNGVRGCLMSHIAALEHAKKSGWDKVLILEDDALFMSSPKEIDDFLERFFQKVAGEWDVLFLGGIYLVKEETSWEGILQINKSLCSHAYIVNRLYIDKLLHCFSSALEMIKNDLFRVHSAKYALDYVWHPFQQQDRWYAPDKQFAMQRMLPSDVDIISIPMNRFDSIICIDTGQRESLREEFVRFGVSIEDLHWTKSYKEAAILAKKLNGRRNLIVEDRIKFPRDIHQLDLEFLHFFRWVAEEWDLYLFEEDQCLKKPSNHFYFQEVKKVFTPKSLIANHRILDTLIDHFEKENSLRTLEIKPEMKVFCSP